jgi:hypothetical protein
MMCVFVYMILPSSFYSMLFYLFIFYINNLNLICTYYIVLYILDSTLLDYKLIMIISIDDDYYDLPQ